MAEPHAEEARDDGFHVYDTTCATVHSRRG